ncbi:hypothetical protein GCM10008090_30710 [Arenicella chitinivorans]|uniref:Uncharacterized protein n=1 Tax=Arenicella chitinivorans TaxID=1329800 RepID=A0A918S3H4_9GAMM|nr:hypothetical protein [Arenicella chitinivorans]GHA18909.1 hypothetical protein GCM10008090_30710 [Arenicella chitinivorans]
MEIKITLKNEEVSFDNLGRVVVSNAELKDQISALVDQSELAACNTCTNTCGNSVNACGNTANGSCSSSFMSLEEITIAEDVTFINPEFNASILERKMNGQEINVEFKGFNSN